MYLASRMLSPLPTPHSISIHRALFVPLQPDCNSTSSLSCTAIHLFLLFVCACELRPCRRVILYVLRLILPLAPVRARLSISAQPLSGPASSSHDGVEHGSSSSSSSIIHGKGKGQSRQGWRRLQQHNGLPDALVRGLPLRSVAVPIRRVELMLRRAQGRKVQADPPGRHCREFGDGREAQSHCEGWECPAHCALGASMVGSGRFSSSSSSNSSGLMLMSMLTFPHNNTPPRRTDVCPFGPLCRDLLRAPRESARRPQFSVWRTPCSAQRTKKGCSS